MWYTVRSRQSLACEEVCEARWDNACQTAAVMTVTEGARMRKRRMRVRRKETDAYAKKSVWRHRSLGT
jgi:hypothetical protein